MKYPFSPELLDALPEELAELLDWKSHCWKKSAPA